MPLRNRVLTGGSGNVARRPREVGFVTGTKLLTSQGYQSIETLRKGDLLLTLMGRGVLFAPIVWIGWRPEPGKASHAGPPIRIRPHAIADNMPATDVVLAPEHGIYIEGMFYLPRQLVNRASILEEDRKNNLFWAVELAAHNVIVADGLPVESFFDDGGRDAFTEITTPRLRVVAESTPSTEKSA